MWVEFLKAIETKTKVGITVEADHKLVAIRGPEEAASEKKKNSDRQASFAMGQT